MANDLDGKSAIDRVFSYKISLNFNLTPTKSFYLLYYSMIYKFFDILTC